MPEYSAVRMPVSLDGAWQIREDKTADCLYYLNPGDNAEWRDIDVPSDIAHCYPERPFINGVFWYRKNFDIPSGYSGRRTILRFDAVNYEAAVFINKKYAGSNFQGFLPFEADLTPFCEAGKAAELYVRVDTRRRQGQLPTSFYWRSCGGILRSVKLYSVPDAYISRAFVNARCDGTAEFEIHTTGSGTLNTEIIDRSGRTAAGSVLQAHSGINTVTLKVENPLLWSCEAPELYTAKITLSGADEFIFGFGFREIAAKNGKMYLNGKEIFLKGFNRHEDTPEKGGATDREGTRRDFELIKSTDANFIRMCHYPHDEYELELADRLGLLLLDEIPLCGFGVCDYGLEKVFEQPNDQQIYMNSKAALKALIDRDRNHPCVAIWSVSNENRERWDNIVANNNALVRLAKKLDPTRPVTHVSNYQHHENWKKFYLYDDVICINDYPWMSAEGNDYPAEAASMKAVVAKLRAEWPEKPVIITEFGYGAETSRDVSDDEEIQAIRVKNDFLAARECASGASVWVFADHPWPLVQSLADMSGYGLLRRDRSKRPAFDIYAELLGEDRK